MRLINKNGDIIDADDPANQEDDKGWKVQDIVKAQRLLTVKYSRMEPTPESIQGLIEELTKEYGYDPVQIQRVIEAHFKKAKKG